MKITLKGGFNHSQTAFDMGILPHSPVYGVYDLPVIGKAADCTYQGDAPSVPVVIDTDTANVVGVFKKTSGNGGRSSLTIYARFKNRAVAAQDWAVRHGVADSVSIG